MISKLKIIDSAIKKLARIEPRFFYFLVVINVIPLLSSQFFLTVDGPAHVYNSNLIVELFWNADSPLLNYFKFNDTLAPNWTGHLILSTLITFLPGFIAEKFVLLFYVVGLPLSARYLFKSLGINNRYIIYLIFPFTYSYLFYYGFFNFNIGVVLFLYGIGLWVKSRKQRTISNFFKLSLISGFICLSHLFVFALFLLTIFILNLEDLILFFKGDKNDRIELIKTYLFQLICLPLGIAVMVLFLFSDSPFEATTSYLSLKDLFISLKYIMPAKGVNYNEYGSIVKPLLYVFTGLILWNVATNIYLLISKRKIFINHKTWLLILLSTFFLIFLLPDRIGAGGFISARLLLFFFIFLIIWLAAQPAPNWIKTIVFITANIVNVLVIFHNYNAQSDNNQISGDMIAITRHIEDYSVILPITYSENFMLTHISNYAGAEKPLIILENYEASANQFPLTWNLKSIPSLKFGNKGPNNCISWPTPTMSKIDQAIDYVCVIADKTTKKDDPCYKQIQNILDSHYNLVASTSENRIKLYKIILPLTAYKIYMLRTQSFTCGTLAENTNKSQFTNYKNNK